MKDKPPSNLASELLTHPWEEPSVFTPEALIEAVRAERQLPKVSVPEVCLLDFDGDLGVGWGCQPEAVPRFSRGLLNLFSPVQHVHYPVQNEFCYQ